MIQQSSCLVLNPITVNNYAPLFECTPMGRASDSIMVASESYAFGFDWNFVLFSYAHRVLSGVVCVPRDPKLPRNAFFLSSLRI